MPRGNDANAALTELTDRFGAGAGRAEDLIQARRKAVSRELRAAQLTDVDENATALLDDAEVAKAAGVKKDEIESKAVRGKSVVAVVRDSTGRSSKVLLDLADFDIAEEEIEDEKPAFSSDAAEKLAAEKGLTPEVIAHHIGEGSGASGTYTKKDVAKAAAEAAGAGK